jgi:hypothetical protein
MPVKGSYLFEDFAFGRQCFGDILGEHGRANQAHSVIGINVRHVLKDTADCLCNLTAKLAIFENLSNRYNDCICHISSASSATTTTPPCTAIHTICIVVVIITKIRCQSFESSSDMLLLS